MQFDDLACSYARCLSLRNNDHRTAPSQLRVLCRSFGTLPLEEITPDKIEALMGEYLEQGRQRSTVNLLRMRLSAFFSWAIRRGHFPGPNPVQRVDRLPPTPGRTRYLNAEEYQRLMLAAAPHLKPIIATAVTTGGRMGEILALRWRDVDWAARRIVFRAETTKTRRERAVPMAPDLASLLRSLPRRDPQQVVFAYRGRPLRKIRKAFVHARRKAGMPELRFHDLRHTFASWYVQRGGDLYRLRIYLGHAGIRMTERYAHLSSEYLQDGERFFGPPRPVVPPERCPSEEAVSQPVKPTQD